MLSSSGSIPTASRIFRRVEGVFLIVGVVHREVDLDEIGVRLPFSWIPDCLRLVGVTGLSPL